MIQILKNLVPRPLKKLLKKSPVSFQLSGLEQIIENPENKKHRHTLKKLSLIRSSDDDMYHGNDVVYLEVGLSAIQCINDAINASEVKEIKQVLDLPCGHGRVLRFITEFFPDAIVTACDTNKDAVDFCKQAFNAYPIYSKRNLKEFNIKKRFDLIWCGSLTTHFNSETTKNLLDFFYRHLNSGGILVFSMHGKSVIEKIQNQEDTYSLSDESLRKILLETQETGYGYADYKGCDGYGISVATSQWMKATLDEVGEWRNYRCSETAWVHNHDVYSVVKR